MNVAELKPSLLQETSLGTLYLQDGSVLSGKLQSWASISWFQFD